ncbi:hypothetical protein Pint_27650 [Pistacia integerrima]|uniref:Uncharacterized protein n=1 Tax=Pistacia integerrima TaxID=434235 RepID=A0ACC0YU73_9ROSI|nr:hypothetical protein Pint_27650 [Pistacia integerrima]
MIFWKKKKILPNFLILEILGVIYISCFARDARRGGGSYKSKKNKLCDMADSSLESLDNPSLRLTHFHLPSSAHLSIS